MSINVVSSGMCALDSRDVATARMVLSLAQQTFGNPATLVQKLLGLSADDYQEVVQSLSASGASYVDIVAAYLHNLRVLYDDCGGEFPPEIFAHSTQTTTEQMVKDACAGPTTPTKQPALSLPASIFQAPTQHSSPRAPLALRPRPAMASINLPTQPKASAYNARRSLDLLSSPRSTLSGPTHSYSSYASSSPTSPNSATFSPRAASPPSLNIYTPPSPQTAHAAATWQAQAQLHALNYEQLLAQSLTPVTPLQYSSAEALLSAQATLAPSPALTPTSAQQQYLSALAASIQTSQQQQQLQQMYAPAMPCAYSAGMWGPPAEVPCMSPTYGLNYDDIKRIWESPACMARY